MLLSSSAYSAQGSSWFIDARLQAKNTNMDLTMNDIGAWTQVPGTIDATLFPLSGSAPVMARCSVNNDSIGPTCQNGNEEIAISFTPPENTFYEACVSASFEPGVDGGAYGGHCIDSIQIVQTGNTEHNPVSTQGSVAEFAPGRVAIGEGVKLMNEQAAGVCRTFELLADVRVTLRLFYKQKISQRVDFSEVLLGGTYDNNPDNSIHWTVKPIR